MVTDGGRYLRVGTALSLLSLTMEHMEERARELAAAKKRAQAASLAKSQFLASMSHELRTPLNAIIGFSEIIAGQDPKSLGTERYREYARDIHDSGAHLLDVINDVLDVAKIEAGHTQVCETEISTVELIASCRRMIEPRARKSEVLMTTCCTDDLPHLLADETKLQQVLLNLLSNAVKFTPAGGEARIEAGVQTSGGMKISIHDSGIGIAENDLERVLEPFEQVDSELNRNYDGTGLGLYLARAFVTLHGGALAIRSRVGQGTSVCVQLPVDRVCARAAIPTGQGHANVDPANADPANADSMTAIPASRDTASTPESLLDPIRWRETCLEDTGHVN